MTYAPNDGKFTEIDGSYKRTAVPVWINEKGGFKVYQFDFSGWHGRVGGKQDACGEIRQSWGGT